jgi:DNA-binding CsgD family transcriptional regulator
VSRRGTIEVDGEAAPDGALVGRRTECEALERLVAAVRTGESGSLVVRGEAGIGKSALLDHAARRAAGCRVARAVGVQSEMELPFAAAHQLCAPMLDRLDRIAAPQRDALRTTFGLQAGQPPDRFLVGLGLLSLLADVAEELPLVCLVDDAQWLDRASAQALAFVARRARAEAVGLVFSVRDPSEEPEVPELSGLPELAVGALHDGDARALLGAVVRGPVDGRVRDRIVAETRGNPLALVELPRQMTSAELAGGLGLAAVPALPGGVEDCYRRRLAALPADVRRLLLVAAAEPVGDPLLVWRAVDRLGLGVDAAGLAAAGDLVEIRATVRFRHPLVRSAVYRVASPEERQRAHAALALATDPATDPDRRAWHRAHATVRPDEDVAAELERSAGRAQGRGGIAAAAAFLERSAALTPDPRRLAERALAAAEASHEAGAPDAALDLLATAEAGPIGDLHRARCELLRAQIGFAVQRGPDALGQLLAAAERLEPLDVTMARASYLDALSAATVVLRIGDARLREVAEAARAAPPQAGEPSAPDLLLDGLAVAITDGYPAGAPIVKRALRAFRRDDLSPHDGLRWLWIAALTAVNVYDYDAWEELSARNVSLARETGALAVLPVALNARIGGQVGTGELAAARTLLDEVDAIAEATGTHHASQVRVAIAAALGREADVAALAERTAAEVRHGGEGMALTVTNWAAAMLCNALGRYEDALDAVRDAAEHPRDLWFSTWGAVELVEAAARLGDAPRAAAAVRALAVTTQASGTELALGMEARSRALVASGPAAEALYREAIDRLGRTRLRFMLARSHLVYGEWLRRERRRLDARTQLRTARRLFAEMGFEAFAQRAAVELLATGETARKRTVATSGRLTPQEAQIARLARDGLSNPEIGARLFISPRTVEYHLRKVFTKLDVGSRDQLAGVLPEGAAAVAS